MLRILQNIIYSLSYENRRRIKDDRLIKITELHSIVKFKVNFMDQTVYGNRRSRKSK